MEATTFTNFDFLNTQAVGYERYLRIPYRFLTENLTNKTEELTTFEAFIQLLANVRYEDISELKGEKVTFVIVESHTESFWKSYHDITRLPATDKIAAFRLWTKLTASEHEKAQAKIGRYYYSLSKTKYCVKALTYLKNKKFNDEFFY